jgi:hypothetical protein
VVEAFDIHGRDDSMFPQAVSGRPERVGDPSGDKLPRATLKIVRRGARSCNFIHPTEPNIWPRGAPTSPDLMIGDEEDSVETWMSP